jgi:hypothetical protein
MTDKTPKPIIFHITDQRTNEMFSFESDETEVLAFRDFLGTTDFQTLMRARCLDASLPIYQMMDKLSKLIATAEFEAALNKASKTDSWGD